MRVIVVGAGVVGLTCAVRLLEEGHRVDVLARDLPRETTSAVAAALWYPYLALPQGRVTEWSAASYERFTELAASAPESGVRMLPGIEVHAQPTDDPWWRAAVPELTRVSETPDGFAAGWSFVAPVIDMPWYLDWLTERVGDLGGTMTRMALPGLPEGSDLVVNCGGIGARMLASDTEVVPVRGQVVYLEQWGLDRWWLDSDGPTYVVPRAHEVVVGGTEEIGEWNLAADTEVAEEILHRAARLVPEVATATVVRHRVGLRPARPSVRVERDGHVVHCYGHGGAGVTLSWGCADEVCRLVGG